MVKSMSMFRELHMMKKLMVILERLVLEIYLDMVLEETLICWALEDYLVMIMIMKTSIGMDLVQ